MAGGPITSRTDVTRCHISPSKIAHVASNVGKRLPGSKNFHACSAKHAARHWWRFRLNCLLLPWPQLRNSKVCHGWDSREGEMSYWYSAYYGIPSFISPTAGALFLDDGIISLLFPYQMWFRVSFRIEQHSSHFTDITSIWRGGPRTFKRPSPDPAIDSGTTKSSDLCWRVGSVNANSVAPLVRLGVRRRGRLKPCTVMLKPHENFIGSYLTCLLPSSQGLFTNDIR
jgi:hypothetical protein